MNISVPIMFLGLGYSVSFGQSVRLHAFHHDTPRFGIVDCFGQRKVRVSRVVGKVFDPTGVAVPGAKILLSGVGEYMQPNANPASESIADNAGRFVIKAVPGDYMLEIETPAFVSPHVEIDLGRDLVSFAHPENLYVMLGLSGSFCPWVTTSRRAFDREVRLNRKRLQNTGPESATSH